MNSSLDSTTRHVDNTCWRKIAEEPVPKGHPPEGTECVRASMGTEINLETNRMQKTLAKC